MSTNIKPKISIIVPVYNVEKYIHKCVQSILAQTFTDYELILVDDESPDTCPAICDEYATKYEFIKVVHKKNGGLASARNAGMKIASGKFIMFFDSDDYVSSDTCQLMYDAISKNPTAWVLSNIHRVNENDEYVSGLDENQALEIFNQCPTYFGAFKMSLSGSVCNKIYNMDIIRENNLWFDESVRFGEDVPFDSPYCQLCSDIVFLPTPLYFYRVVDGSLTHTYHADHLGVYIKLFGIRLPLIKDEEIPKFCDTYFYYFTDLMKNTHDKRNPMSFFEKMRYNHKMMNTKEFIFCAENTTGNNDSPLYMRITRMHNYYLFWLFLKLCDIKQLLFRDIGEQ